jgi:hypothetical protein
VEEHLRKREGPQNLVEQLEGVSFIVILACTAITNFLNRHSTKKQKSWLRNYGVWLSSSLKVRKEVFRHNLYLGLQGRALEGCLIMYCIWRV